MPPEDLSLESVFDAAKTVNPPDTAELPDSQSQATSQATGTPAAEAATSQPAKTAQPTSPAFSLSPAFSTRAAQAGLDFKGIDSQDKLNDYLLEQFERNRAYADYGRSALTSGANQPAREQAEPEAGEGEEDNRPSEFDVDGHFKSLWSVPQLDDQAKFLIQRGIVELGEDGLYAAKPGYEAIALPVLNTLNQAHVAQREQMEKLFQGNFYKNVYDNLLPALKHELSREFPRYYQEQASQQEQSQFMQKFVEDNASWLYGPDGQYSAKGIAFRSAVIELQNNNITDPKLLAKYALLQIGGVPQSAQPEQATQDTQQTANQERPRDEQGKFVKAKDGQPVVSQKSQQESFLDSARKNAAASKNQGGYTEAAGEYVPENEGDLDNLWTQNWKKHVSAA